MPITLSARSLSRLDGVHPDLVRVIKRAALLATPEQDFLILEGVRSRDQMAVNYGKGRTAAQCLAKGVPAKYAKPTEAKVTWLSDPYASNHGIQKDGLGHAIDGAPYPAVWDATPAQWRAYGALMKAAAHQEGVKIVWGGDWKSPDRPHIELA